MSYLHLHLAGQIAQHHAESLHALAHAAPRIAQAEALAAKLASCGVLAISNGNVISGVVHVWVSAYPLTTDALDAALTKLDLLETERAPYCAGEMQIRLRGFDLPLFCSPRPERPFPFPARMPTA